MVGQSLQKTGALLMNFVTEVEMRKWSFDTILPSKNVSDQISANSLLKGSSIFSLSISFLLRFPNDRPFEQTITFNSPSVYVPVYS